jgi:hypothetical protein
MFEFQQIGFCIPSLSTFPQPVSDATQHPRSEQKQAGVFVQSDDGIAVALKEPPHTPRLHLQLWRSNIQ